MIKFSVVVPVYNVEKYLKRCIHSILEQNYENYEIILVDDGSTDNSGKICDELAQQNEKIKVIHKTNEGLGLTRNVGLDLSSGDFVFFVDSDDYIGNDMFNIINDILLNNKFDVCVFGINKVTKDGAVLPISEKFPSDTFDKANLVSMCLGEPLKNDSFEVGPAWKAVYNKRFLDRHKIRFLSEREVLSEDYLFSAAVCSEASRIHFCNVPFYFYCDNETSLTNSYRKDRPLRAIRLYHMMMDLIIRKKLGQNAVNRVTNNLLINILVSFKHISLNGGMNSKEKYKEIENICMNKELLNILKSNSFADTIKLKFLRFCIIHKCLFLIKHMMHIKYGRNI